MMKRKRRKMRRKRKKMEKVLEKMCLKVCVCMPFIATFSALSMQVKMLPVSRSVSGVGRDVLKVK